MALVFGRFILAIILATAAVAIIAPRPAPAADVTVILDQAQLLKLPERTATLVIGNPLIADASIQNGGLMVVTGKGYGATNLIALDRSGVVLMERFVEVRGPREEVVVVYRGSARETYSCTPECEPRITLGDSTIHYNTALSQTISRNLQAQSIATSR